MIGKAKAVVLNGFLDRGARFEGKLEFDDTFRIDGILKGTVISPRELVVGDGLVAEGDQVLLRQLLTNLFDNAWKFTSRNPAPRIELGWSETPQGGAFFLRDNGIGFDMVHAQKLFAPFRRLVGFEEFPGTGIGLATVHRIVQRHGGRIWFESVPGQGASFHFIVAAPPRKCPPL